MKISTAWLIFIKLSHQLMSETNWSSSGKPQTSIIQKQSKIAEKDREPKQFGEILSCEKNFLFVNYLIKKNVERFFQTIRQWAEGRNSWFKKIISNQNGPKDVIGNSWLINNPIQSIIYSARNVKFNSNPFQSTIIIIFKTLFKIIQISSATYLFGLI